jgi:hypothetical protein
MADIVAFPMSIPHAAKQSIDWGVYRNSQSESTWHAGGDVLSRND